MKYHVILRNGRYALLEMETQFVVACGFDETQPEGSQWDQGYYYTYYFQGVEDKQRALSAALELFRMKTETDYIPRCRLEELATLFKDAVIEDTIALDGSDDGAMHFFDFDCDMTDEEKKWFEIGMESEEF